MLETLVVTHGGRVIGTINWMRAIKLAYFHENTNNTFVLAYHDKAIRSPSKEFVLPSVLLLTGRDIPPPDKVPITKRNVWRRDDGICQWCGKHIGLYHATVDHVFPVSRGGTNTWRNVVAACKVCNTHKGNMTGPEYEKASGKKLLKKPHVPRPNIRFSDFVKKAEYASWLPYVERVG